MNHQLNDQCLDEKCYHLVLNSSATFHVWMNIVWMNQDSYAIAYFTSTALAQQCMHSQIRFSNGSWALLRPYSLHPVSFASAFIHPVACFSMYLVLSYAQASQQKKEDAWLRFLRLSSKRWWQDSFLVATSTSTSSRLRL